MVLWRDCFISDKRRFHELTTFYLASIYISRTRFLLQIFSSRSNIFSSLIFFSIYSLYLFTLQNSLFLFWTTSNRKLLIFSIRFFFSVWNRLKNCVTFNLSCSCKFSTCITYIFLHLDGVDVWWFSVPHFSYECLIFSRYLLFSFVSLITISLSCSRSGLYL